MDSLIQNISDTAKWVAVFRADETERSDAVFHDPFARSLAGVKGEQIANAIEFSRKNSWSFVARTFLFDEIIRQYVELGFDTIINLAAGLDTRPFRMPLPSTLNWIEVDLPGIIHYKTNILAGEKPKCYLTSIPSDLSDRKTRLELFAKLGQEATNALIVTEGLIVYLNKKEVGEFAKDLSGQRNFRRWVLDLMSPGLLDLAQKEMGTYLKEGNSPLKFAPEEGEDFFIQYGWKAIDSRSLLKTAATLNRLSDEMLEYAAFPEPEGPKGAFPWSGVCLFENINMNDPQDS